MKYVGSKAAIVKHIAPIIQSYLQPGAQYVEPFVGGANAITSVRHDNRVGNDVNLYVIALLAALRDGWVPVDVTRELYEDIRSSPENHPTYLVGWAGIGCSYSGKWFGGYAGVTNTKGGTRDYIDEARRNCMTQAPLLKGVEFRHGSYDSLEIPDGSVVYCDPPYVNTLKYPGEFDTGKFWIWCREMSAFNTVLVSEHVAPEGWVSIWSKERGSSLSANGTAGGRRMSIEHLFILDLDMERVESSL